MKFTRTFLTVALTVVPMFSQAAEKTTQEKLDDITQILQENPQVLDSLHQNLQEYVAYQKSFSSTLEEVRTYLNDGKHSYFGAENPELTIINVTDYSCPFCKRLEGELVKVEKAYPQIKSTEHDGIVQRTVREERLQLSKLRIERMAKPT